MKKLLTLALLCSFALLGQSCRTTEVIELQPVVRKPAPKPAPKPKPRPRTPTPAETKVVNQYD